MFEVELRSYCKLVMNVIIGIQCHYDQRARDVGSVHPVIHQIGNQEIDIDVHQIEDKAKNADDDDDGPNSRVPGCTYRTSRTTCSVFDTRVITSEIFAGTDQQGRPSEEKLSS